MRALAMRGGDFTADERQALLDYCQADVDALAKLLPAMLPAIDLPRALIRGRYMAAAARMERNGIPIDDESLIRLRQGWIGIKDQLIERVDAHFGVYEGRTFHIGRFAQYLIDNGIPWPRLPSGSLAVDDDTFRETAKSHPQLAPLRELRHSLSDLRLESLTVGSDGRNRCLLSAFNSQDRPQPAQQCEITFLGRRFGCGD